MTHPKIISFTKIVGSSSGKLIQRSATLVIAVLLLVAMSGPCANAQTFSVLYNFGTLGGEPLHPDGTLAQGLDGKLYSSSTYGGSHSYGTVFRFRPTGALSVVHSYDGTHGGFPMRGLVLGIDGNFYGAYFGVNLGINPACSGLDRITPSGELTLFPYCDALNPRATPIQSVNGHFYGTMEQGGQFGNGVVYEMTPTGQITTLHDFSTTGTSDGSAPEGSLVQATNGDYYGTTLVGGSDNGGTVFRITGGGNLTVLHNFSYFTQPRAALVEGNDGNLYGVTEGGGQGYVGMVYRISPSGVFTVLHDFDSYSGTDGYYPAGLFLASDGNFYGTTEWGGTANHGTIFRLSPGGDYSVIYSFDGTTGDDPISSPFQHTNGILYGHTQFGGTGARCGSPGCGTFYSLDLHLDPFVRLVSTTGNAGVAVKILGQGLTGATAVSFNGTPATYKVWSDSFLSAKVPSGATTGPVTVSTPGGTLTSNVKFRVHPVIISVSPASGSAGTSVAITGTSLSQTTKVVIGGVRATSFTVDSDTQVTAAVPAGASTGYIVLTTTGGRSRSPNIFTVTP